MISERARASVSSLRARAGSFARPMLPRGSTAVLLVAALVACDGQLGGGATGRDARGDWLGARGLSSPVPGVGRAVDASVELGAPPLPASDPGTSPSPDPGSSPAPDPGSSPAPDPGSSPAPDPSPSPSPDPAPAPAPAPLPPLSVVFSHRPADDSQDTAIEDAVVSMIGRALPGSTIRIAVYTFTRNRVTDALVAAHGRGVDVQVVLDGDAGSGTGAEAPRLVAGLGAARVRLCDAPGTACIGSGIMHDKLFLFSALDDGSREVVVQASHNFTTAQLHMHNNAVIVAGDSALFAAYSRTFVDLFADREVANYYRIDDGDGPTRAYFFPRTDGDTVVSILGNVECDGSSRIRVAMAFFTDARDAVARALAARRAAGCSVEVVAGDDGIPLGDRVATILRDGGVRVVRYPARTGDWGLHSKYLLIDAPYAGSGAHRRLVFTGSHNWTGAALTINDEALLRIDDGSVFDAFMADWAHVAESALRP